MDSKTAPTTDHPWWTAKNGELTELPTLDDKLRELQGSLPDGAPTAQMKSTDILAHAASAQNDRARHYDAPNGERSMTKTVAAFNAVTGMAMTEVQGWQFMELLKMVRSSQGAPRADNFVDGASYASLAGEAALNMAST